MAEGVTVSQEDNGQRLDRWIKKHYPEVAFGEMQKILRTGQVRVDGKRVKGDARLAAGQLVRIPPQFSSPQPRKPRGLAPRDIDFIRSLVIYSDEHIIAINKPSGLATQGGTKIGRHVDGLLDGLTDGGERPALVHRLDKDTSGVLLLARNTAGARAMGELFSGRDIRKYYWAVVAPAPKLNQGKVKSTIAKVSGAGGERMMAVGAEEGKIALSYYSVMERIGNKLAWLAFWPRTGRTHQLRVHAVEMGTPILGDFKYDPAQPLLTEETELPHTLHLHARRVIFRHPVTGKKTDITAPLGSEMKKTFAYFGFDANDSSDPFAEEE